MPVAASSSTWKTSGRASRPSTFPGCSSVSTAWTRLAHENPEALAWGSPSPNTSSWRMAGQFAPKANLTTAQPSFSRCQARRTPIPAPIDPRRSTNSQFLNLFDAQRAYASDSGHLISCIAPMSTALKVSAAEPAYVRLIKRTVEACEIARQAAAIAAEGIATGSMSRLNNIRQCEKELDAIDAEIDSGVTSTIAQVTEEEARQLLACMKVVIGLERIGDLLLSFASSAQADGSRLDSEDARELTQMATLLEKMLADVGQSFSERDVKKAIGVLRADAEMDRLRNLIFMRHIENPENIARQASLQVIFMTQSLERAGDHAKNLAEEVCHFVSGRSVRHVLLTYDKPIEQMFIDWLRHKDETG